jgi:hypothetical protein
MGISLVIRILQDASLGSIGRLRAQKGRLLHIKRMLDMTYVAAKAEPGFEEG